MTPKVIHNPVTGSSYEVAERTSKTGTRSKITGLWSNPENPIDVKGSILPDLEVTHTKHPLKGGQQDTNSLDSCRRVSGNTLERAGVVFSMAGAAVCAMPASVLNTFVVNGLFLIGDIFLLTVFSLERRINLIVQNGFFAALAAVGVVVNFQGGIL